jgi:cell division inhibitor SulA
VQYKVLYDFIAQHVSEASVKAGDVITVVETAEDGWFTMLTNDARKVIERATKCGQYTKVYIKQGHEKLQNWEGGFPVTFTSVINIANFSDWTRSRFLSGEI